MRGDAALLTIGLILVCVGILALVTAPPRIATTASKVSIPYTILVTVPPGPHNFTRVFECGKNSTELQLPETRTLELRVSGPPSGLRAKINCTHDELNLFVWGEGVITATSNAFINVTLSAVVGGKEVLLDALEAPINISGLAITGTPITVTMTPGSNEETVIPHTETSYDVISEKGSLTLHVVRKAESEAEVVLMPGTPIKLLNNTSKVILKVSSNAEGRFRASLKVNYVCVITKYFSSPQYVPRVTHDDVLITDKYLNLGNLPTALILMMAGLALMNVGCYLRAASAKTSEEPQPQAGTA